MRTERYASRDRSYGVWHRMASIARFLRPREAASLTMADLDSVLFAEYDHGAKLPLCLVEVARDIGQEKPAGVIRKLAELADIPAYVALYELSDQPNPGDRNWPDIAAFRVRRLWPQPEAHWRHLTPEQWAAALVRIRGWQLRRFEAREAANDPEF
ncbi:MAG: hypothetical protein J0H09_06570 [Burkholderiales bacterium]|nr:hypothetical protein [Burkholderiales bacterium]ODU70856.1 MAG: hypothetical protein ABT05_01325 [Lautropia sp. SCN 66-9]